MRAVGITGIQRYQKGMTNAPAAADAPRLPPHPARSFEHPRQSTRIKG